MDIVDRLRGRTEKTMLASEIVNIGDTLCHAAADEIERLRGCADRCDDALRRAREFCLEAPCLASAYIIDLIDEALDKK